MTANGTLSSKIEALLQQEHAELLAAKDAEIAELKAKLAAIAGICGLDHVESVVALAENFALKVTVTEKLDLPPKRPAVDADGIGLSAGADLIDLTDDAEAKEILDSWVAGTPSAPNRLHDLLLGRGHHLEASVMFKTEGNLEPSYIAAHQLVNEAVFHCRPGSGGTPQSRRDRLEKLFGKF